MSSRAEIAAAAHRTRSIKVEEDRTPVTRNISLPKGCVGCVRDSCCCAWFVLTILFAALFGWAYQSNTPSVPMSVPMCTAMSAPLTIRGQDATESLVCELQMKNPDDFADVNMGWIANYSLTPAQARAIDFSFLDPELEDCLSVTPPCCELPEANVVQYNMVFSIVGATNSCGSPYAQCPVPVSSCYSGDSMGRIYGARINGHYVDCGSDARFLIDSVAVADGSPHLYLVCGNDN